MRPRWRRLDMRATTTLRSNLQATMSPHAPQPTFPERDAAFMQRALALAVHARDVDGEVPVGAVLVLDDTIVGEGWNRNITLSDPTAHAEMPASVSATIAFQARRCT